MLITIPNVLTPAQIAQARHVLAAAEWVDGRVTAGHQSAHAKDNLQIPEGHPAAMEIGDMILTALGQNPLFISAALPMKVFPPLFNSYGGGQSFGTHVDNAIRHVKGSSHRVRSDLSATLFLTPPTNTTAAISSSKTPTASIRQNFLWGTWWSIPRRACIV